MLPQCGREEGWRKGRQCLKFPRKRKESYETKLFSQSTKAPKSYLSGNAFILKHSCKGGSADVYLSFFELF